jgi:hypothetical protein
MPRVPRQLARRLDRLARRAHRFHRFAHHPLCDAYAGEVLRVGRRGVVCRGCAAAAAGAAVGAIAGLVAPVPATAALGAALAIAAPAAVLALAGRAPWARRSKLATRAAPVAAATAIAVLGARSSAALANAVAAAVIATLATALALYRRRGPDRAPCADCPERWASATCSGYRRVVRREAAFGRLAGRLLAGRASGRGTPG